MQAMLILAVVGAMIASWMAAGTIPTMMYYGIKIISPKVFLLTACILCSIVSLATGPPGPQQVPWVLHWLV